jgi:hypothetical protein
MIAEVINLPFQDLKIGWFSASCVSGKQLLVKEKSEAKFERKMVLLTHRVVRAPVRLQKNSTDYNSSIHFTAEQPPTPPSEYSCKEIE